MARGVCPECGGAPCALRPVCPGEPQDVDPLDCDTCGLIAPCETKHCAVARVRA